MSERSTFLFARPSFVEGMARNFDFGNTMTEYNRSQSEEQADAIALRNDWYAVGDDLRSALKSYIRALERWGHGR